MAPAAPLTQAAGEPFDTRSRAVIPAIHASPGIDEAKRLVHFAPAEHRSSGLYLRHDRLRAPRL
jgi:hypothetical protein